MTVEMMTSWSAAVDGEGHVEVSHACRLRWPFLFVYKKGRGLGKGEGKGKEQVDSVQWHW